MSPPDDTSNREERLAAKLRENLRRRKAQGRALAEPGKDTERESPSETLSNPPPDS